jgi:SAM-dependent methyltransferase
MVAIAKKNIKKIVKENYGRIAVEGGSCCGCGGGCGCGQPAARKISKKLGYSDTEIKAVPAGSDLGLGCGNPVAFATLKKGETVLDLGSGAGLDCFISARKVGEKGKVIGVDMTPEMIKRARGNAVKGGYKNVEFRQGTIEKLPVEADTVDAVISNCVINLSTDKPAVFREAFRVLKPGGRIMVSDIGLKKSLPAEIKKSVAAYVGCFSGAVLKTEYLKMMKSAGFSRVEVQQEKSFPIDCLLNDPTALALVSEMGLSGNELGKISGIAMSISVLAFKPAK